MSASANTSSDQKKTREVQQAVTQNQKRSKLTATHPLCDIIRERIANAAVLDVGCVGHGLDRRYKTYPFLHDILRHYARRVIGIDIQKKEIEQLRFEGYNVFCQDAESFSLKESFDVIIAGDVIEHLSNPGLFLDRCHSHLRDNGTMVLATPNAFCINRSLANVILLQNDPQVNPEHTMWLSPSVVKELLARSQFAVHSIHYINSPKITKRLGSRITDRICALFGSKLRETMVIVAHPRPIA